MVGDNNQWNVVQTETRLCVEPLTETNSKNITQSNKSGKVFIGVRISATAGTNSTNTGEGNLKFSGVLAVNYGGKEYSGIFEGAKGNIISRFSQNLKASVLIPAKEISSANSFDKVSITGNWSMNTAYGTSMLCWPIIPYPKKLKHNYIK